MGTVSRNPRRNLIAFKLTDDELRRFELSMRKNGFLSRSMYLRSIVFNTKHVVRRDVVLTDNAFRSQVNALSLEITRIGTQYNQATARFNALSSQRRPDGSPVIDSRSANRYLKEVEKLTRSVKRTMDAVIEIVAKYTETSIPAEVLQDENHK